MGGMKKGNDVRRMNGHSPDKAGRSEVGRRSVGGRSAVGERRSEVGRRSEVVGGRSEGRSGAGRRSVEVFGLTHSRYVPSVSRIRELPLPSSCCKGEACLPKSHYQGEPRVNNCVIEPPTDLRPAPDRTGARPTCLIHSMTRRSVMKLATIAQTIVLIELK